MIPNSSINMLPRGTGEFVHAYFPVPQNPVVMPTGSDFGMGEFVHAHYALPQNPIADAYGLSGCRGVGCAGVGCGMGCSCGGSCSKGMGGIGSDFDAMFAGTASMTTYVLYGGGALAILWFLMGRGSSASGYSEARRKALARVREEYPSRGSRALRRVRSVGAY
jgi:hypothetical protein